MYCELVFYCLCEWKTASGLQEYHWSFITVPGLWVDRIKVTLWYYFVFIDILIVIYKTSLLYSQIKQLFKNIQLLNDDDWIPISI